MQAVVRWKAALQLISMKNIKLNKDECFDNPLKMNPHKLGETMYSEWGKYVDHANHEVSEIAQKFAWFNAGITLI